MRKSSYFPDTWRIEKSQDYCSRVADGTHDTPKPVNEGKRLVTSKNIKQGRVNFDDCYYISENDFININRRSKVDRGDVLFSMIGTVGEIALVKENPDYAIKNIGLFKPKTYMDGVWLYYYLTSSIGQRTLDTYLTGTSQQFVSLGDLRKVPIVSPPDKTKRKIAVMLSAYDDLIENNNRRIAILEKMVEELYREWFVRLRFPGSEKVKIVKGVPEGWEVKELQEVTSIVDCLHTKKPVDSDDGEGWLLQLENIKENGRFSSRYKFMISKPDYEEWTKNIEVKAGDCLITNVGRIAAVAQIPHKVKAALGRNMTAVRPTKIPATFLIQFLLSPHMKEEVLKKQDLGAIMGALNVRAINKLKITIPDKDLLNKFDMIVSSVRKSLWDISDANDLLETSRDRLLSRLMSGKIDTENMDIQFSASMQEELAHA